MRNELKNLFSHKVILEDTSLFYYTIKPYELTNALGNIVATLQEYNFTKKDDTIGQFSCKLYKTKEGNWYDFEDTKSANEKGISRMLKTAIDEMERKAIIE